MKNARMAKLDGSPKHSLGKIVTPRPNIVFGGILLAALLAFEIFNFSTTDFALKDLLGDLSFAGIPWATILAVAFCSIDFAGIARIFAPHPSSEEPREAWYLFGAWFLAATMNAILTWWGISLAIAEHALQSTAVVDPTMLTSVVPVFVALMVWMTRILVIGSLTVTGGQLLEGKRQQTSFPLATGSRSRAYTSRPTPLPSARAAARSTTRPAAAPQPTARRLSPAARGREPEVNRAEPTYHSLTRSARQAQQAKPSGSGGSTRRM